MHNKDFLNYCYRHSKCHYCPKPKVGSKEEISIIDLHKLNGFVEGFECHTFVCLNNFNNTEQLKQGI